MDTFWEEKVWQSLPFKPIISNLTKFRKWQEMTEAIKLLSI
jgi:hypothetical protein